jgi:hypothetical protein
MNDTQIESHIICRWMSFDDKTKLLRSTCLFFVFRSGVCCGCLDNVMLQNCLRFEFMFQSLKDYSEALYIMNINISEHMH